VQDPVRDTPTLLGHLLEVREVAPIVVARVPGGVVPLQRAVVAREVLGDLVAHRVHLSDGWQRVCLAVAPGLCGHLRARLRWWQIPAPRVLLVEWLAVRPAVVGHTIGEGRGTLQDPLIETILAFLPARQTALVEPLVADPELVVAHVVRRNPDGKCYDFARCVRALDRSLLQIGLVSQADGNGMALHGVPAKAM